MNIKITMISKTYMDYKNFSFGAICTDFYIILIWYIVSGEKLSKSFYESTYKQLKYISG